MKWPETVPGSLAGIKNSGKNWLAITHGDNKRYRCMQISQRDSRFRALPSRLNRPAHSCWCSVLTQLNLRASWRETFSQIPLAFGRVLSGLGDNQPCAGTVFLARTE